MKKLLLNIQMFANPLLPTDGTHEMQERYANTVLKLLRKKNSLRNTAGRIFEGSPKAGAVKIPVRDTEVAVGNYDVVTGLALGTGATSYLTVTVDKNVAVNELIDGYEAQAVPDGIVAQRLVSAAYSLDSNAEADLIAEILATGTASTNQTALVAATAYNSIVTEIGELLKIGVEPESIKVAITSDLETILLQDQKYTNTASSVGSERAMSGVINLIRGAEVFRSDKLGLINTTENVEFVAYSTDYVQAGDEWVVNPQINDLKNGTHIGASALQGRWVYFNKVTRATGVRIKHDSAT